MCAHLGNKDGNKQQSWRLSVFISITQHRWKHLRNQVTSREISAWGKEKKSAPHWGLAGISTSPPLLTTAAALHAFLPLPLPPSVSILLLILSPLFIALMPYSCLWRAPMQRSESALLQFPRLPAEAKLNMLFGMLPPHSRGAFPGSSSLVCCVAYN